MGNTNNFTHPMSLFISSVFCIFALFSEAANTITQGQQIKDSENHTIISSGRIFELGFFSPDDSSSRYVGIWYFNIAAKTIVWVANRENPIAKRDGILTIGEDGNLILLDGNGNSIWSSNLSTNTSYSAATLMDSGDLMLSSNDSIGDPNKAYWRSFDHPTDTFLPGMKARLNGTQENHMFKSWKSSTDPSAGNFTMGVDSRDPPQIVIWENTKRRWRSGHWNGLEFLGVPDMKGLYYYGFKLVTDDDGTKYFAFTTQSSSQLLRFRITYDGYEKELLWNETSKEWTLLQSQPNNSCEEYNKCGDFGRCTAEGSPICSCLKGFKPKNSDEWSKGNWSGGCVRESLLQCQTNNSMKSDGFWELKNVKLPDFADLVLVKDVDECRERCLGNCSCNAYAYVDGINCMIWNGNLVDNLQFEEDAYGRSLYIRLSHSELGGESNIILIIIIVVLAVFGALLLSISIWVLWRCRPKLKGSSVSRKEDNEIPVFDNNKSKEYSTECFSSEIISDMSGGGPELPLFNFNCIAVATNYFSNENMLGQGGFGPVYKGKLPGGQDIAVKRLSKKSGQGILEFKNEIILIARLQHRNLVRLLGCCIEEEEKMLIYEYMPNKSLNSFIFDPAKQAQLDWSKRFSIIEGIARGLLYLHRDSRLRIIHRDLKAGNILLNEEMNPKISDFGMARIFGGNQNEANTVRVVGTYGYMAPEYAMEGLFSVKSDVYSFGVLVLEIVSGRRCTSVQQTENLNLIRRAWNLWQENKGLELLDPSIKDSCSENEVLRCIQVGLLCVQDSALNRPTMSSVMLMLEGESISLPLPREPTFTSMRCSIDKDLFMESLEAVSSNNISLSTVIGR
ncbi:Bulb-type lectin domain [Dillenia turbinata]|uniref:Receptor-like serine/threonine-protein kinase n=1 Tax=Dillenia turbinata TaxID=194707 RepID=A0AAN8UNH5_9MAGN